MGVEITAPPYAGIKTGTYTGNGIDDRNLDIGVNLASKKFPWVVIKKNAANDTAIHRIEYGQGDLTMAVILGADEPDRVQQFTATGFQVGTNTAVNENGILYRYIMIWQN